MCALSEYIRRQRSCYVQEMLKSSKTVAEIAGDVGFSDYNYFSLLLKNTTDAPQENTVCNSNE